MGEIATVVFVMVQMWRRFATTGLMVAASLKDQATVGVVLLPESGALHAESEQIIGNVVY